MTEWTDMSNKSTGNFRPDKWLLTFKGGPLDGKTKKYPYLPDPRFGCRSKDTGEQFFYKVESADEATGKATMVLG